ncbi:MAG: AAA family ATPase [Acidimicrobiaceae bacterium]|nr:AAA family ATPase [Acidimicrobiaceae bacterium]
MRIGQAAMNAALEDLRGLQWSTKYVSLYESFLVAKWFERHGRYSGSPSVEDANEAVAELFVFDRSHENGRLSAFRYDWKLADASGRKTVWNNTTRAPKVATSIFVGDDIRNGLRPDALAIMQQHLGDLTMPSVQALACLVLRDQDFSQDARWDDAVGRLHGALGLTEAELSQITVPRTLGPELLSDPEWSMTGLPERLAPPALVAAAPPSKRGGTGDEVIVGARTERMLRRAVANFASVLLVGPPGTGKGRLVRWIAEAVRADPTSFGFPEGTDPNPMWRTPEESWSAFEMIGGLAPREGELAWSSGVLLNSLTEQRWLVLDETNRADMDKIMGPLLTWLAGQDVEVGRTAAHGGHPVILGWSAEAASAATDPLDVGESTDFVAGTSWRLLGTYNPQDAQRVFRFGQALSRRFTTVPVPALSPGEFESLLNSRCPELGDDAKAAIIGLYSAHYARTETALGPAVFLRAGAYLTNTDPAESADELVAEAYVLSLGKYLSSFDDLVFDDLGRRVVEDEDAALSEAQWAWVAEQRDILG